jgi:hypothetical protein
MTTDRDTTRIVRSWMDEGVTQLPDRVLDAVLDQIPTTQQRQAGWPTARRFPVMSTIAKFGAAAIIVAAAVMLGYTYLSSPDVGSGGIDDPTPAPTATATTSTSGLEARRYSVQPGISAAVSLEVPAGWSAMDAWAFSGPIGHEAPNGVGLRFYTVTNLLNNPSSLGDGPLDPPVGPTVDDLMQAIVAQTAWTSSSPTETVIGGYPAQHVQVTIPDDAELESRGREGDAFYLFLDGADGQIYGWAIGQTFDVYAVDVNGERLVFDGLHYPGTSEADLEALQAVVDSIRIEP